MSQPSGRRPASLFSLALLLLACGSASAAEVVTSAGGVTYSVRLPENFDPARGARLVVGLHGQGGNHARFLRRLEGADFLADSILITPNAPQRAAWREEDLPRIADLVREVQSLYTVTHTIAFGFSRGAYFGFGLGLRHPDCVQAVVLHSGGLVVPVPTEAALELPFYVIHGDRDWVVPSSESESAVNRLRDNGFSQVEFELVTGLGHRIDGAACRRAFAWAEAHVAGVAPGNEDQTPRQF